MTQDGDRLEARVTTVSPESAAERLGVQPSTLANWRWNGAGPRYLKVGGRVRYRLHELAEWLDARARSSTSSQARPRGTLTRREKGGDMHGVVSTADLAEELGVQPETVVRWIREKRIRSAVRRQGRWCIPMEEAEALAQLYGGAEEEEGDEVDEEAADDSPEEWDEEDLAE